MAFSAMKVGAQIKPMNAGSVILKSPVVIDPVSLARILSHSMREGQREPWLWCQRWDSRHCR
jgi:hypothetical protein